MKILIFVNLHTLYNQNYKLCQKMQMMAKLNAKMDVGWKITYTSCPVCNGTTMAEPKPDNTEIYCPKCDKNYPLSEVPQPEQESEIVKNQLNMQDQSEYYDQICKTYQKQVKQPYSTMLGNSQQYSKSQDQAICDAKIMKALKKTNDISKKIGEKLLQGWTMLNETCLDCLAPLMKSRKGEKICFGCNKDFAAAEILKKTQSVVVQQKNIVSKNQIVKKPISKSAVVIQNKSKNNVEPSNSTVLSRIQQKALNFLQSKIDRSIQQNDLSQLQRLLSLIYKIKSEFK